MQGVIKAYDPANGDGLVMCDTDFADYELASDALVGSIFRMLRQGQRVIFDLDAAGRPPRSASAPRSTWAPPAPDGTAGYATAAPPVARHRAGRS